MAKYGCEKVKNGIGMGFGVCVWMAGLKMVEGWTSPDAKAKKYFYENKRKMLNFIEIVLNL